jgi:hypothetical protein
MPKVLLSYSLLDQYLVAKLWIQSFIVKLKLTIVKII